MGLSELNKVKKVLYAVFSDMNRLMITGVNFSIAEDEKLVIGSLDGYRIAINSMERIDFENDERLSIVTVANKCGIEMIKPIDHNRILGLCPFCNDTTGHLYLLTLKNNKGYYNVYKCLKCGKGGGAVALYTEIKGLDTKE